ncbi:WD40 repeat domain-containing protein [Tabrizicola sp.]|uniref:WD40 repeat domain-containing protein n=1 Tax=Tabrizicola sp. TaxID=2005166 RepID=UPI0027375825|nr:WD40 repeat domain-containing protein [Tabrizicola sp.]MDP3195538.1 WD40 repeat domain-containing protein [Tabrizicola sp.]
MKDERANLQLFDLIAREWQLPAPVTEVVFNATNTAVAFGCADGSIHLASTSDKSSPNQRTRRAVDTGRVTIAPREGHVTPLRTADHTDGRSSSIGRHGQTNFLFAKDSGRINTLTPGGLSVHLPQRAPGPIRAVAARPDGTVIAWSSGSDLHLGTGTDDQTLPHPAPVHFITYSPDGSILAAAHATGMFLWTLAPTPIPRDITLPAVPTALKWSDDGKYLAVLLETNGFCLVAADGTEIQHFGSFPAPVRSIGFNLARQTVVASGAYRPAAWSLTGRENLISGKSGLILIDAIATCPTRNLVAVGYANGLVSLAEIGQPTEILLRENTGAAVRDLAWSECGNFLALAGADGTAALVEFPEAMFKPTKG